MDIISGKFYNDSCLGMVMNRWDVDKTYIALFLYVMYDSKHTYIVEKAKKIK